MDPLFKVKQAKEEGKIPEKVYLLIKKRFPLLIEGINRIEKASGLHFPIMYVEPSIVVSHPTTGSFEYGILFARTIPLLSKERLHVVIQVSAPLVAYGLKGTIHAILAHEFLHYLELIRKVSKMDILSDEISGNLFEGVYADEARLFDPNVVFNDKTLLLHITKKFPAGFKDFKLEDKVMKYWMDKKLPTTNISLDTNIIKLSAESLAKIKIDPVLLKKLDQFEKKKSKIRRKKYY